MLSNSIPKISVIIGVLNMYRYLSATIDSVLQQNYANVELIIIDGGSTDGTVDTIKQYEKHITYWVSEKDNGHCDACNKAIDIATGDFIVLLNADDTIGKNLFQKIAAVYSQHPETKIITCGVRIFEIDSNNRHHIIQEIISPEKLQITLNNMLFELPVINARFFHKDIFKLYGKFQATHPDGSYNLSNDRDFLANLAVEGLQSEIIPEPLYIYFSHSNSLTFSSKNTIKIRKEHLKIADKFLLKKTLSPEHRNLFLLWLANESAFLFLTYLKQASLKNAFALLKYGISQCGLMWFKSTQAILTRYISKRFKKIFFQPKVQHY